jgi:hypothetical protein
VWKLGKDMHNTLELSQTIVNNLNFVIYQYSELSTSNLTD